MRDLLVLCSLWLLVGAVGCDDSPGQTCGDGIAAVGEYCDGYDLRGATCTSLGLQPGTLRCSQSCTLDTSGCGMGPCGDGVLNIGEQCDGADFGGQTCDDFGLNTGNLSCTSTCFIDTSGCVGCGDGLLDPSTEECDGDDLGSDTCSDHGFYEGVMLCSPSCTYDVSDCELSGYCGDDEVQVLYESCEPWAMTHDCRDLDYWGGELLCPNCEFVTSSCIGLATLSAGAYHACGLDTRGDAWCWGHGNDGQLGTTLWTGSSVPLRVTTPAGVTFTKISAGGNHSCALDTQGRAWCWGDGEDGQVGNNTTGYIWSGAQQVDMPSGVSFATISCGYFNSCALDTNGSAWCWGLGSGRIGDGTTDDAAVPTAVSMPSGTQFASIDVFGDGVCALDASGAPWCWGIRPYGCGSPLLQPTALSLPTGVTYQQIDGGGEHSCALDSAGDGWCWGRDNYGQLGNGSDSGSCSATAVSMPTQSFVSVGAGSQHSCGLTTGGTVYCWGRNGYGQVGDGTTSTRSSPVVSQAPVSFTQLAVGHMFTCALTANGVAWCWGHSVAIGNGSTGDSLLPVQTAVPD